MASIADLRWKSSRELLADVDLDVLYVRQVKSIGGAEDRNYPYMLLVHTGKIMIGIDLGQVSFMKRDFRLGFGGGNRGRDESSWVTNTVKETYE